MNYMKKLFSFPGPKDLGKANSNYALPSRLFNKYQTGYTWEDHDMELKKLFPLKYFFLKRIPEFINKFFWWKTKRTFKDIYYWLQCHLLPSYHFHILDLRQPKGSDHYSYGWRDIPEKMLYANFNLLKDFLEKENPYDPSDDNTLEEIYKDPGLITSYKYMQEAKFLHHWWTVIRKEKYNEEQSLLSKAVEVKNNKKQYDELMEKWREANKKFDEEEQEMLIRLIKIREFMWT